MLSRSHSSVEDLHGASPHVIHPQNSTLTFSQLNLKPQIGSYSMNALRKKQAKINASNPSSAFKQSESNSDKKFLTQRLKLPIAEADSFRANTPSIGTCSGGTSRRTDKSPRITTQTKGKEMLGSLSYRALKSEPYSSEKSKLAARKRSGSDANNMKLDFSKVANKSSKESIDVTNSNRSVFLIKKLEQLIQKLKSQKEDLQSYTKPRTARPSQANEKDAFSQGVLALITTRGYNNREDDVFIKAFVNCENEWKAFAEDVTKVLSISTKRKGGNQTSDSERKSDISNDIIQAMKLDNMYDIVDCIDEETEMKLSARELWKFQEDLKKQKAKIDEELEKQMSERKTTEENMDSFLRKLLDFQTNFNSKAEKLHFYVESSRNTDLVEEDSQEEIQPEFNTENESFTNHIAHQSCTNSTSSVEPREEKRPDTRMRMVLRSSSFFEEGSFIDENNHRSDESEGENEPEEAKKMNIQLERNALEICPQQESSITSSNPPEINEEMSKDELINRIRLLEEELRKKSNEANTPENKRLLVLLEEKENSLRDLRRENEAIKAETTRIAQKAGAIKNKIFGAHLLQADPLELQIRNEIAVGFASSAQTDEDGEYNDSSRVHDGEEGLHTNRDDSASFDQYEEIQEEPITHRMADKEEICDGAQSYRRKSNVASRGEY